MKTLKKTFFYLSVYNYFIYINAVYFFSLKKTLMKNNLWLICVLTLLYSCKQTQLTSNYSKRPNKIYTETPLNDKYVDVVYDEKKTSAPSISKQTQEKLINPIEKKNKKELFTEINLAELKKVYVDHQHTQKFTRLDSIVKSKNQNLSDDEEILELSNKAKKYSLYGLLGTQLVLPLRFIFETIGSSKLSSLIELIMQSSLILASLASLYFGLSFLLKALKLIKKRGEKTRDQNKEVKKNLKIAKLINLLVLVLPLVISLVILISVAVNGIGLDLF